VVRDPGTGFPGQFPVAPLGKMFIPITAVEAIKDVSALFRVAGIEKRNQIVNAAALIAPVIATDLMSICFIENPVRVSYTRAHKTDHGNKTPGSNGNLLRPAETNSGRSTEAPYEPDDCPSGHPG
jgi:hypothetical protein